MIIHLVVFLILCWFKLEGTNSISVSRSRKDSEFYFTIGDGLGKKVNWRIT